MRRLYIVLGLVLIVSISFLYWMNREPKELFSARLYTSHVGLTGSAGILLHDNNSYAAWWSGCFGGYSCKGDYSISNDTLYISDLNNMIDSLEIRFIAKDSILEFESCDTLILEKFRFVLAEKNSE